MKIISALFAFIAMTSVATGFLLTSSFTGSSVTATVNGSRTTMEYVPSGMSKEQYRKLKEQEAAKVKGKNLGKVGITSFKSRTFTDWQMSGGKNLFPVDPNKVKNAKEIPYMQRPGGAADDSTSIWISYEDNSETFILFCTFSDLNTNEGRSFGSIFGLGKKKAAEPEPEPEKPRTNWWTLG